MIADEADSQVMATTPKCKCLVCIVTVSFIIINKLKFPTAAFLRYFNYMVAESVHTEMSQ